MNKTTKKASGVILICNQTNKFLLVKRGDMGSNPGRWSMVSGAMDPGEKPLETTIRELWEETGIRSNKISYNFFEKQEDMGIDFYFFLGFCDEEFECTLNDENTDWGWFDMDTLPKPLFPTLYASLLRIF